MPAYICMQYVCPYRQQRERTLVEMSTFFILSNSKKVDKKLCKEHEMLPVHQQMNNSLKTEFAKRVRVSTI